MCFLPWLRSVATRSSARGFAPPGTILMTTFCIHPPCDLIYCFNDCRPDARATTVLSMPKLILSAVTRLDRRTRKCFTSLQDTLHLCHACKPVHVPRCNICSAFSTRWRVVVKSNTGVSTTAIHYTWAETCSACPHCLLKQISSAGAASASLVQPRLQIHT